MDFWIKIHSVVFFSRSLSFRVMIIKADLNSFSSTKFWHAWREVFLIVKRVTSLAEIVRQEILNFISSRTSGKRMFSTGISDAFLVDTRPLLFDGRVYWTLNSAYRAQNLIVLNAYSPYNKQNISFFNSESSSSEVVRSLL